MSVIETIASVPWARRAGSIVTARLKRWSVDLAIAGFPKCGNTWYGAMLKQLILERHGVDRARMRRLFVSDLGPLPLAFAQLPRGIPRIYHSHFMPYPERPGIDGVRQSLAPFAATPMIVLIRDCKDALVSYYMMGVHRFGDSGAPRDIAEFVLSPAWGVDKFIAYYNEIARSRRGSAAPLLVTSYEALWRDTAGVLARDAAFAGLDGVSPATIAGVVEQYSFANMRAMELASSAETEIVAGLHRREEPSPDAAFVRQGGSGNWRAHLAPAIAARIDAAIAERLDPMFAGA